MIRHSLNKVHSTRTKMLKKTWEKKSCVSRLKPATNPISIFFFSIGVWTALSLPCVHLSVFRVCSNWVRDLFIYLFFLLNASITRSYMFLWFGDYLNDVPPDIHLWLKTSRLTCNTSHTTPLPAVSRQTGRSRPLRLSSISIGRREECAKLVWSTW